MQDIREMLSYSNFDTLMSEANIKMLEKCYNNFPEYREIIDVMFRERLRYSRTLEPTEALSTIFKNQDFKRKSGFYYMSREFVNILINNSYLNNRDARRKLENGTICVFNSLNGILPKMLRKIYPNARIVCLEYFSYHINHLKDLGFETYQVRKENKNLILSEEIINIMKKFGKFDLCIGNPPYNDIKTDDGPLLKNLYQRFLDKALEITKDGGWTLFVTPPGCLKTTVWDEDTKLFAKIKGMNLIEVNLRDAEKHFNVGTPVCYYLIQNAEYSGKTTIISDEIVDIDIKTTSIIPRRVSNRTFSIINKIVNVENGENFNIRRNTTPKTNKYVTIKRRQHVNNCGVNAEIGGENTYDLNYDCDDPELIEFVLSSKLFRYLNTILRYDAIIYHKFWNGFRHPKKLNELTDKALYTFYGLVDEDDIAEIENV